MPENTAVFPRKYYAEEMKNVDPRFHIEKHTIVIEPHLDVATPPSEDSIVIPASKQIKTLVIEIERR